MRIERIFNAMAVSPIVHHKDAKNEFLPNCPVDISGNMFVVSNFYYACTSSCQYSFDVEIHGNEKPYHREFRWLSRCSGQADFADYAKCEFGADFLSVIEGHRHTILNDDTPRGERRVFAYISRHDSVLHLKYLDTLVEEYYDPDDDWLSNAWSWFWNLVDGYKSTKYYYTANIPVYKMIGPDHAKQATHFEVEETACYSIEPTIGKHYYHYENEDRKEDTPVMSDEEYRADKQADDEANW